jgi:hypothetical protein
MVFSTIGAFEGDGVAAGGNWARISFFFTPLIAASVVVPRVGAGTDGTGVDVLFAERGGVAELITFAALGDGGGVNEFLASTRAGKETN